MPTKSHFSPFSKEETEILRSSHLVTRWLTAVLIPPPLSITLSCGTIVFVKHHLYTTQRTAVTMRIWLVIHLWTKINKASPVRNLTSIWDIENKGLHLRFSHFPTDVGQKRGIHLECAIGANNSLQCRRPCVNIYKMEGAQVGQKEGHGNSAPARTMDIDLSKQRTAKGGKTIHPALVMLLYDYFSRGQFPIHFNKEKKMKQK